MFKLSNYDAFSLSIRVCLLVNNDNIIVPSVTKGFSVIVWTLLIHKLKLSEYQHGSTSGKFHTCSHVSDKHLNPDALRMLHKITLSLCV